MKTFAFCWLPLFGLLALPLPGRAQGVGIGTTSPDAAAVLDLTATGKGLLIPRMDSVTRVRIVSPPTGLLVFQTDGRVGFWYQGGGSWLYLPDKARSGDNLGNHQATKPISFGTTDADKLIFTPAGGANGSKLAQSTGWSLDYYAGSLGSVASGQHRFLTGTAAGQWAERLRISPDGRVGIGTSTPSQSLEINGSAYVNAENSGFVADAGGEQRVGLMKYTGRPAGLWRVYGESFEIGRMNERKVTAAQSSTSFFTDIYLDIYGKVGIGTNTPAQALDVNGFVTTSNLFLRDFTNNKGSLIAVGLGGRIIQPITDEFPTSGALVGLVQQSWVWSHGLGYKPVVMFSVEVLDGSSQVSIGYTYEHIDNNSLRVKAYNIGSAAPVKFVLHGVVIR